jgi:hypothetical protein
MIFVASAPDLPGGERRDRYLSAMVMAEPDRLVHRYIHISPFFTLSPNYSLVFQCAGLGVFIPYISGIPARLFSESTSQNDD